MITDKERAAAGRNTKSRRRAIDLMCKDCIYDDHERGAWRMQTDDCPSTGCPLYNFRPRSTARGLTDDSSPQNHEPAPVLGVEVYRK